MSTIDSLKWRYATKKFDASKKVSEDKIETIKEAIQLSASSYGLQLFKTLVITDQAVKEQLVPASWGQQQLADSTAVIVFAAYDKVTPEHIDENINLTAKTRGITTDSLQGYGDFIKGKMAELPQEAQQVWTNKQAYIALGSALIAAAELKVDTCPMEGFDAAQYDQILGLSERGLTASVVLTVGYRHDEDATQHFAKVRKSKEDLFINI